MHSNSTGIANLDLHRTAETQMSSVHSLMPGTKLVIMLLKKQEVLATDVHTHSISHLPSTSESVREYSMISHVTSDSPISLPSLFQEGFWRT